MNPGDRQSKAMLYISADLGSQGPTGNGGCSSIPPRKRGETYETTTRVLIWQGSTYYMPQGDQTVWNAIPAFSYAAFSWKCPSHVRVEHTRLGPHRSPTISPRPRTNDLLSLMTKISLAIVPGDWDGTHNLQQAGSKNGTQQMYCRPVCML